MTQPQDPELPADGAGPEPAKTPDDDLYRVPWLNRTPAGTGDGASVTNPDAPAPPPPEFCYIHTNRPTRIKCRRCGRPICGECMVAAAVGFQCPQCVKGFTRRSRQRTGPFGGTISKDPNLTTYVLIGLNVAVFALILFTGGGSSVWLERFGLAFETACWQTPTGCDYVLGVHQGGIWRLVTSLFTHQQVLHLGMNMLTLWFLGPNLERLLGRARFLALYLLSGLAGSVCVIWLSSPYSFTIGASGCMFGLIGALIVILHKLKQDIKQILLWLLINVVFTVTASSYISWQGHLGGLLGGAAVAAILIYLPRANRDRNQWLAVAAFTLLLALGVLARVLTA